MTTMQVLESQSARARVKAHVYDKLVGRGEPPRGWTREAMLEDYVDALGGYPEHVLAEASRRVRSTNTRPTWPMAGMFKTACDDIGGTEIAPKAADDESARIKRSQEAHDYAARRLMANEGELQIRAFKLGPWAHGEIKRFLFDSACKEIREGRAPHVSNADLDQFIRTIEPEAAERQRCIAAHTTRPARKSIGALADKLTREALSPTGAEHG